MSNEQVYLDLLQEILEEGEVRGDRTGTGTVSLFGKQMVFDLTEDFPLLTTKKVHFKSVVAELLWMIRGQTNINQLDASIWNEWADENGDLGPVYGKQWRSWSNDGHSAFGRSIDQLANVICGIQEDPEGRRHIVSAWNVGELDQMALPPCHLLFQFYVSGKRELDCQMYQRSADMFLGVPFNIASYALLTHIVAYFTNLRPGRLSWVGGDCHIYTNHLDQVERQLQRLPNPTRPQLRIEAGLGVDFDEIDFEHIHLTDYHPQSAIKGDVAV